MGVVVSISYRNLLRQKRRNILLGTAIALGVAILIVANSFSNGITDILLNKIVVRVAGHVQVAANEKGSLTRQIFRDKDRLLKLVRENAVGVREMEEAIGVVCRVIGNGKSDTLVIVGVDLSQTLSEQTRKELEESFRMIEGRFEDLSSKEVENPVILSEEKARYLNVKKGDIMRMRYTNIFGGDDTARVTVSGIVRNDNVFMQAVMFGELQNLKHLLGYRPYEIANINITINDPEQNAVKVADSIHKALTPGMASIYGTLDAGSKKAFATVMGIKYDDASKDEIIKKLDIIDGKREINKDSVLVSSALSKALNLMPGSRFMLSYKGKFQDNSPERSYTVDAVFEGSTMLAMFGEKSFYDAYYDTLPEDAPSDAYRPDEISDALYGYYSREWELLPRTTTTDDLQKKIRDISRGNWRATTVDVRTMYESASDVLKLQSVLNLITLTAVLILFVIILIGIVNTMRMSIRERTREIGTIRAIGMQRKDVRNSFMLEAVFLSLIASLAGIAASFVIMHILSSLSFQMKDNPLSILLVNSHLYFKPTFWGIASNMAMILAIVAATAYLPARRASNLSPSAALRHFE